MGALSAIPGSRPQVTAEGQSTSWQVALGAGAAPRTIIVDIRGDEGQARWLTIRSEAVAGRRSVLLRVQERFQRSVKEWFVGVGPGNGIEFPAIGSVLVDLESIEAGGGATLHVHLAERYFAQNRPVREFAVGGLVRGGVGIPGAWTDASPFQGYAEAFRQEVVIVGNTDTDANITTDPLLHVRVVDDAGVQRGVFTIGQDPSEYIHPPRHRLQVRHPGDAADTRGALLTWFRR